MSPQVLCVQLVQLGMDSIWSHLPRDLVDRVCNQLPKVRAIPENLKDEIVNQRWRLEKLYNNVRAWYGDYDGYYLLLDDLNILNESDFQSLDEVWIDMAHEKRVDYYKSVMD